MRTSRLTLAMVALLGFGAESVMAQQYQLFSQESSRRDRGVERVAHNYMTTTAAPCCAPEPACCEPEPVCCEPEPVCCEPEPTCCAPEPTCCEPEACCEPECCEPASGCGCEDAGCGTGCGCDDGGFCDHGDPINIWSHLMTSIHGECYEPCLTMGGWTQVGYHTDNTGLFNNHADAVRLHQQWLWFDYRKELANGVTFGARMDAIYGYDGPDTQAFGDPGAWDSTWTAGNGMGGAIPQLYGEIGIGDLSVKIGHFYTLVGYEVVQATGNFFYSHAFSQYTIEPFTHTGVLASYAAGESLTLHGGWTLGWDTGFSQFSDGAGAAGNNYIGGFSYALSDAASFTYITTIGDFGLVGEGYEHSAIFSTGLGEKTNLALVTDYLDIDAGADYFSTYGYLTREINGCLSVGGRAEWFHISDTSGIGRGDLYEVTAGVNIRPHSNVVFRPEYRYQWGDSVANAFVEGLGGNNNASIWAIDMVVTY